MSALNVVKEYYQCFNNRNWDGMLALLSPEIRHEPNQGDPRIGKEKFTEFLKLMDDSYEERLTDIVFLSDGGMRVAVEFVVDGIYKKGEEGLPIAYGQSYKLPAGAFLEVENSLIKRVTTYYNLPLWISLVS